MVTSFLLVLYISILSLSYATNDTNDTKTKDLVNALRSHQNTNFAVNRCSKNITKTDIAAMISVLPRNCSLCRRVPYLNDLKALGRRLECPELKGDFEINIFAAAIGDIYERLIPFYAFFALSSNIDAVVEVVVTNTSSFIQRNARVLDWLLTEFGRSICVRNLHLPLGKLPGLMRNTARFLEVPVVPSKYTYIGDTDILMFESVLHDSLRLEQMALSKLPYSNIVRNGTKKLTGLLLVDTKAFYSAPYREMIKKLIHPKSMLWKGNDEVILYSMVQKIHGLPDWDEDASFRTYRPVLGLHLSPNRIHNKVLGISSSVQEWCKILTARSLADFLCSHPDGCAVLPRYAEGAGLWHSSSMRNSHPQRNRQSSN